MCGGRGLRVMNKIVQKISVSYDDGGYKGMWSRDWGPLGGGEVREGLSERVT